MKHLFRSKGLRRVYFLDLFSKRGGFGLRMNLFGQIIEQNHSGIVVSEFRSVSKIFYDILKKKSLDIYFSSSYYFPLILLLKCLADKETRFNFLVRGDELFWHRFYRNYFRLRLIKLFIFIFVKINIRFLFVSNDLLIKYKALFPGLKNFNVFLNTGGKWVPKSTALERSVAVVGDFGSVKNIEFVIRELKDTNFTVHVYGNSRIEDRYQARNIIYHGFCEKIIEELRGQCSFVIFSSFSEGFPNLFYDALKAGCAVLMVHRYPFEYFGLNRKWVYRDISGSLEKTLEVHIEEQNDFYSDNIDLLKALEEDWVEKVEGILE